MTDSDSKPPAKRSPEEVARLQAIADGAFGAEPSTAHQQGNRIRPVYDGRIFYVFWRSRAASRSALSEAMR